MFIKTPDGMEIFYKTYGEKENIPIVLVHGFGADHKMWTPQLNNYPFQGLFIINIDVRGHGSSSKVTTFSYTDCAKDINQILEQLKIEKTCLAGVSMGGNVVQQFACDFPEKVDKLIISDSFSGSITNREKFQAWLSLFALKIMPKNLLAKGIEIEYKKLGREDIGKYFKNQIMKMDIKDLRQIREKVNKFNIIDRLHEIKAPTLVLTGDQFGKWFINMGRITADGINGARFKVLKGGADPSNLVATDIFDKEVINFVKSNIKVIKM